MLQFLGFLEAFDLHFAPDILGSLSPFQFDGFDAKLIDDIFLNAQSGVFHISLDRDCSIPIFLKVPEKFHARFHIRRTDNFSILDLGFVVHAADIFSNRED
ncbi:hypothetical protein ES703_114464 [subsurface metagenome]